ncbi:MAG TPA: hypothetical protein DCY20_05705 [Firmicutes bacterium]|nr:hypothetical protein [Bacillota bacterium]
MPLNALLNYLKTQHHITLTEQQLNAVSALHGPVCVISCPGSGKTTITVIRLANLIVNGGVNPKQILALTFSKASAADMNKRFGALFPKLAHSVKFSTIHSFAFHIIRTYQHMMSLQYQFIDSPQNPTHSSKGILSKLYLEITNNYPSDDDIDLIKSQISLLKNLMIEPTHTKQIKQYIEDEVDVFTQIYKQYETFKERQYLLDYDDLLTFGYQILKNNEQILAYYRQTYTHIQVDEAQDTSKIQYELIKLLLNKQQNLFLVGDDDQSIYAFRGAYPKQLLDFKETFKQGQVIFMSENFRSSQEIVSTSATFITQNKDRYEKNILTHNPPHSPIACLELKSEKEQLDYLVSELQGMEDYSSVAILYRQNVSAISVLEVLERFGIPFRLSEGRLAFFTHPIVLDVLAFYDLASHPRHQNAFKRLSRILYLSSNVVNQTLTQTEMGYLAYLTKHVTFAKKFQRDKVKEFSSKLAKILTLPPAQSLTYLLETLDYRSYLNRKGFFKEDDLSAYTQGVAVFETMKMIARSESDISGFLHRLGHLKQISEQGLQEENAVSLMTFHASKGLEFDCVFMIDCMNGITPPQNVLNDYHNRNLTQYEEEARLFYVAMTRARKRCEMMSVGFKHNTAFTPSNFFQVVDEIVNPTQQTDDTKNTKKLSRPVSQLKNSLLSDIDLTPFIVGSSVMHKKFGEGEIIALEGEIATIKFSDNHKRISLRITLQNETLSLVTA